MNLCGCPARDESSKKDGGTTRVKLYPHEQPTRGIWEIPGTMTATWLRGVKQSTKQAEIELQLRNRVARVIEVNPWLAGWLELSTTDKCMPYLNWKNVSQQRSKRGKEGLLHNEKVLEGMIDRVFRGRIRYTEEALELQETLFEVPDLATTPQYDDETFNDLVTYLRGDCEQTKMPNGFGFWPYQESESPPIFKVAWDRNKKDPGEVVLVVSLAHAVGDGTTYYQIFQMLLGECEPYALDASRRWGKNVSKFVSTDMGDRKALTLNPLVTMKHGALNTAVRSAKKHELQQQTFLRVNLEGVKRIRQELSSDNGRVSTNDVLLSVLSQLFQIDARWHMWKDFRHDFFLTFSSDPNRPQTTEEMVLRAAGNYIGLLNIFAEETKGGLRVQSVLQKSIVSDSFGQINHKRRMGNISNWTGLQKLSRSLPQDLQSSEDALLLGGSVRLHLPVPVPSKIGPYSGSFIVFHPNFEVDEKGVKKDIWVCAVGDLSRIEDFVQHKRQLQMSGHGGSKTIEFQYEDIFCNQ